jgi:fructose-1,6-bisphosphatase/inositol monophosphatase family enzyme
VEGQLTVGVVEVPALGWTFYGARGGGAFLERHATDQIVPLQVSQTASIGESLLATGFPYDSHTSAQDNLTQFAALQKKRTASAASAPPRSTCRWSPPAGSTATGR